MKTTITTTMKTTIKHHQPPLKSPLQPSSTIISQLSLRHHQHLPALTPRPRRSRGAEDLFPHRLRGPQRGCGPPGSTAERRVSRAPGRARGTMNGAGWRSCWAATTEEQNTLILKYVEEICRGTPYISMYYLSICICICSTYVFDLQS